MKYVSPYLKYDSRLAEVVGALQVLGSYSLASQTIEVWEDKLGKPSAEQSWSNIFLEHPEFFRVNENGWVSLRWRHGYDRNVSIKEGRELTTKEIEALDSNSDLTRKALTIQQIEALMKTAIEMHGHAITHAQEKRWQINLLFTLGGIIIGALINTLLK